MSLKRGIFFNIYSNYVTSLILMNIQPLKQFSCKTTCAHRCIHWQSSHIILPSGCKSLMKHEGFRYSEGYWECQALKMQHPCGKLKANRTKEN